MPCASNKAASESFAFPKRLSSCRPQYVTENEGALQQVKALLASTQKDKQELANQLEEEKR